MSLLLYYSYENDIFSMFYSVADLSITKDESNEIVLTNHTDDGNICNNLENTEPYYKMGTWDGVMLDGNLALQGVYPFVIEYKQTKGSVSKIIVGHITLIR